MRALVLLLLVSTHAIADASLPAADRDGSVVTRVDEGTASIIKRCVRKYSRQLKPCPPSASTRLHFVIDQGRVEDVRAANACLADQISRWGFPVFVGRVVVDYP